MDHPAATSDEVRTAGKSASFERGARTVIRADRVSVTFGLGRSPVRALGPFSLDVREGEFVSIVGPSGCGKSTLLRTISGLVTPTSGRVEIVTRGEGLRAMATVFQDYGIFPWKTVAANVEFGLVVNGMTRKVARSTSREWLRRLGLSDFAETYPSNLSGGMRQRVSIARALAVEPEILLMDEPFASLDAQLRAILQEELLSICQTDKRTVVFVTHSLEEALLLSDRVVVMTARPGVVLEDQPVEFPRPRSADLRDAPEFGHLRLKLWEHLRSEVQKQMDGPIGTSR